MSGNPNPESIEVGDNVEVPGGMDGSVKFVGEVKGKKGYFVGVELSEEWAARGKNNGDAEGVRYFSTSIPGAGIFLPINRAVKRSLPSEDGSVPPTPSTPAYFSNSIRSGSRMQISGQDISPTPSAPKFSQSMLGRAPSPALRPKSRPSLPRPESPLRRSQMGPPPATHTPGRPSLRDVSHNRVAGTGRYVGSPIPGKVMGRTPSRSTLSSSTNRPPGGFVRPPSRIDRDNPQTIPEASAPLSSPPLDGEELTQLRSLLREKNQKIADLTRDFDAHRLDFRNTLDALDLARTETERVYETRIQELTAVNEQFLTEREALSSEGHDVASVAMQLRGLEDVVQELEEGLEDARRGEAEARGEVEFLRGEVERLRAELRWERERGEKLREGMGGDPQRNGSTNRREGLDRGRSGSIAAVKKSSVAGATNGINGVNGVNGPPSSRKQEAEEEDRHEPPATRQAQHEEHGHDGHFDGSEAREQEHEAKRDSSRPQTAHTAPETPPRKEEVADVAPKHDEDKWCALCEQTGHDSVSCPNEEML